MLTEDAKDKFLYYDERSPQRAELLDLKHGVRTDSADWRVRSREVDTGEMTRQSITGMYFEVIVLLNGYKLAQTCHSKCMFVNSKETTHGAKVCMT